MKEDKKFKIVKPHFRFHYRKQNTNNGLKNHYALIIGSDEREYAYNYLTHSKKNGSNNNKKLKKNPKKNDNRDAYITKKIYSDKKNKFSKKKLRYLQLEQDDENEILNIIKKNKHFN